MKAYIKNKHIVSFFTGQPSPNKEYDEIVDVPEGTDKRTAYYADGEFGVKTDFTDLPDQSVAVDEVINITVPEDTRVQVSGISFFQEEWMGTDTDLDLSFSTTGQYNVRVDFHKHNAQEFTVTVA